MKKVIIVHRWEGNSHGDWYPWLQQELEKLGCEVHIPDMPDTDVPVIDKWVRKLSEVVGTPNADTYFIGHSIGCQTILRYLETIDTPIGGVVFVAPWFSLDNLEDEEVTQIAKPWIETPVNFEHIKTVAPSIQVLISSNEPYGCIERNTKILEEKLNAKVFILENKGHFTEDDECKEIPEARNLLLEIILKKEYPIIYEWTDAPNAIYENHKHEGKVSFFVVDGSVTFSGGINKTVSKWERFDVPVGIEHSAVVSDQGCTYIVGQEIEGDA